MCKSYGFTKINELKYISTLVKLTSQSKPILIQKQETSKLQYHILTKHNKACILY